MPIDNIHIYPKELTPSMKKYKDKFYLKSNKIDDGPEGYLEDQISIYNVIEWDNGWAQFAVNGDTLFIKSMFSESNTKFKFKYIYELAKSLGKKEVVFETERNPKAWIRLLGSQNYKTKLKAYLLGVKV